MIEQIIDIDVSVFKWIHHDLANTFMDRLMPMIRNKWNWIPLYAVFVFFAITKYKMRSIPIILGVVLTVILADQFSAGLIKDWVQRVRPCNDLSLAAWVRPVVPCGGGYSFISAHATNHFALAVYFSWFFSSINSWKGFHLVFYLWAALISFAQVYVGVHFPLDVIVGGIAGVLIGHLMLYLSKLVLKAKN
ncbi:MAG: phosphatase PAP2 family protein [Bacteroidia bacterium]